MSGSNCSLFRYEQALETSDSRPLLASTVIRSTYQNNLGLYQCSFRISSKTYQKWKKNKKESRGPHCALLSSGQEFSACQHHLIILNTDKNNIVKTAINTNTQKSHSQNTLFDGCPKISCYAFPLKFTKSKTIGLKLVISVCQIYITCVHILRVTSPPFLSSISHIYSWTSPLASTQTCSLILPGLVNQVTLVHATNHLQLVRSNTVHFISAAQCTGNRLSLFMQIIHIIRILDSLTQTCY